MQTTIRPIRGDELPLLRAHFERHIAESGNDENIFIPYVPADAVKPSGGDPQRMTLSTDEPHWQRWFGAFVEGPAAIVGHVDLKGDGLHSGLHRCELGIGIERPARGQGLGRQLMQTAIDYARTQAKLEWVDLRVFAHNRPARALYKQFGFREVCRWDDRFRVGNTVIDDILMSLRVGR